MKFKINLVNVNKKIVRIYKPIKWVVNNNIYNIFYKLNIKKNDYYTTTSKENS